jgi:MFS family permease
MLAVFTVSVGYGVVLPLLPDLIEQIAGGLRPVQVSQQTGLLTAGYTFALFLFAPAWGRLSDRRGRRVVLLIGLFGFGAAMLLFTVGRSLTAVYAERFLSGMFASAVTPVAAAAIGDLALTEPERVRRLTLVSMAGVAGFLLGPMLGVFSLRLTGAGALPSLSGGSVLVPMAAAAVLAFLAGLAVALALPGPGSTRPASGAAKLARSAPVLARLLALAFIVSAGLGVFEVGLVLRGKQELGLTPFQIALLFTECSLVMLVVQAIVFAPGVAPAMTRWLIAPGLAVLAGGLLLLPRASGFPVMLIVVGSVAASTGILSPILTYWISTRAGKAQGWELGKQTAAAGLGVTLGSGAGGLFFSIPGLQGGSFVIMAGLAAIAAGMSLTLPAHLVRPAEGTSIPPG